LKIKGDLLTQTLMIGTM